VFSGECRRCRFQYENDCEPGNPLSTLVQTRGTQAFIHLGQVDTIENVATATPIAKILEQVYSRFYTRPNSSFNYDPYMSTGRIVPGTD
jgi:hypothetical protein